MPASMAVRATLAQAEAVAAAAGPGVRAVVVLLHAPGDLTVVGEPADRAALPEGVRTALEAALRGR